MTNFRKSGRVRCALLAWALTALSAHAQLLIGQTVGTRGSAAATVQESMRGAQLYFAPVNAGAVCTASPSSSWRWTTGSIRH